MIWILTSFANSQPSHCALWFSRRQKRYNVQRVSSGVRGCWCNASDLIGHLAGCTMRWNRLSTIGARLQLCVQAGGSYFEHLMRFCSGCFICVDSKDIRHCTSAKLAKQQNCGLWARVLLTTVLCAVDNKCWNKLHDIVAYIFMNICVKFHQFLWSSKKCNIKEKGFFFAASGSIYCKESRRSPKLV